MNLLLKMAAGATKVRTLYSKWQPKVARTRLTRPGTSLAGPGRRSARDPSNPLTRFARRSEKLHTRRQDGWTDSHFKECICMLKGNLIPVEREYTSVTRCCMSLQSKQCFQKKHNILCFKLITTTTFSGTISKRIISPVTLSKYT